MPEAIADHLVIGNKRTAALVARDGTIDWLCPQRFDSPSVFAAILDPERGGAFTLHPDAGGGEVRTEQRYRPDTNVAETTFATAVGTVRVTDAMALPSDRALDYNQLIRRVDGLDGEVTLRWRVAPRFSYGAVPGRAELRGTVPVIAGDGIVLSVESHGAGEPAIGEHDVSGAFTLRAGDWALLALTSFDVGPIAVSTRPQLAGCLEDTAEHWRRWARRVEDVGPYTDACRRSALALDLLVDAATGGIVAAPTLALPERPGGERNYDYRYVWLRDMSLTLEAMLRLGLVDQVHASLRWMFEATARSHPRLRPVFTIDRLRVPDAREIPLDGYDGTGAVRVGNRAGAQLQLDGYAHVFDMVAKYVRAGNALTDEVAQRLAELADFACLVWRRPDHGLWELPREGHYTQSKLACHLALQRAAELAARRAIPGEHVERWQAEIDALRAYVHRHCWDETQKTYTSEAGSPALDAAVLLAARGGLLAAEPERLSSTIDAIRARLGAGGPLLSRTTALAGREGAFLACSFWLAEALARAGRVGEAQECLGQLLALTNPGGLLAEELDPATGAFRGNFPQALTHLALINAADVCARAAAGAPLDPTGDLSDA